MFLASMFLRPVLGSKPTNVTSSTLHHRKKKIRVVVRPISQWGGYNFAKCVPLPKVQTFSLLVLEGPNFSRWSLACQGLIAGIFDCFLKTLGVVNVFWFGRNFANFNAVFPFWSIWGHYGAIWALLGPFRLFFDPFFQLPKSIFFLIREYT